MYHRFTLIKEGKVVFDPKYHLVISTYTTQTILDYKVYENCKGYE